jgi:hypothetical protein
VQDGVETQQINQVVGADRDHARGADAIVDLLDRQLLLLLLAPDLGDARVEDSVDDEPWHLGTGDRLLANRLGEGDGRADGLRGGLIALHNLDQRHDRGRVEVVEADDHLRPQRCFTDLGDRQRRCVRCQDRVAGRGGVELGEDGLLDLDLLRHRLDHEVDVAEGGVGGAALNAPEHLLDLRLALLLGELALLDQLAHLALRDLEGAGEQEALAAVAVLVLCSRESSCCCSMPSASVSIESALPSCTSVWMSVSPSWLCQPGDERAVDLQRVDGERWRWASEE